jgi:hypothetical protein
MLISLERKSELFFGGSELNPNPKPKRENQI